tara:strand:- start:109 stop:396 length:288 start_codon:yes stop_codon:yes gene_type:complete
MLIVVEFEPASFIEITIFAEERSIRTRKINTRKVEYSREEIDKMVGEFCRTFVVMKKMYTDIEIKQYAKELACVYNILGLKIWENKRKKKWGLKE